MPLFKPSIKIICLSCILIVPTGCALIPADRGRLPQLDVAQVELAEHIKLPQDTHRDWPQARWWQRYDDAQLDRLIEQALQNPPTLQIAATRVETAHAVLAQNRAEEGVNTAFNADSNRRRYSGTGLFPAPIGGNYFNETAVQVQASYDFDWWGKRRAAIAAALGEENARQAEYAQTEQTLTAVIVQHYFNLQAGWARLDNLQKMLDAQNALLADKRRRIDHGLAAGDERRTAEADIAGTQRLQAAISAQCAREIEALRALLGADHQALTELRVRSLPEPSPTLPSRLGIELLARRPDLQAARWRVEAALSRIEATEAAFYPDINLAGAIGFDSLTLEKLLKFDSRTLFLGPALSLPLFDSGRLRSRLDSARAQRDEVIADYNQSVFAAVHDVAQEAATLQGLQREREAQEHTTTAANHLFASAEKRFEAGLLDRSTVLSADLVVLRQHDARLQLQNQELSCEIALIKALGGGFSASPETRVGRAVDISSNKPIR